MLDILKDNFYLQEREAQVYLAALELGRSRVSDIARQAGLNRITTYEILKRLRLQGLATSATFGDVQTFQVIPPNLLVQKMEQRLTLAKGYLPQLSLMTKRNQQPKIQYYEGAEGLRSIYEDTLTCNNKVIYELVNARNLIGGIGGDFLNNYVKRRARNKIRIKILVPNLPENKKYQTEGKTVLREIRFFDDKHYKLPNDIMIYDNKLSLLSFSSRMGVIIEDKEIAESMLTMWQLIWDNCKE